ncbi:hypothetical protein PG984_016424 [Apiospora sp. TS-2023a]
MERRTYESPMDWEYQTQGPMDPNSPFARSIQKAQKTSRCMGASPSTSPLPQPPLSNEVKNTDTAFGAARPSALAANSTPNLNMFPRSQTSSSNPQPASSNRNDAPSSSTPSSSSAHPVFQRTSTAPPFRNPAFTTPRKPFDMDPLSEVEDSPAATDPDASELYDPDTPEDNYRSLRHMSLTPARPKSLLQAATRRSPGKGEIPNSRTTMFSTRDKIRKRKRRHDDKDISGYRLPYKYSNEWEESEDPDSDDSTYEPNERPRYRNHAKGQKGCPHVLGYWLTFAFNAAILGFVAWIVYNIISAFRIEMGIVSLDAKSDILDTISKCQQKYIDNRCHPREQRLPALSAMCDEWEVCMNQNPDTDFKVRHGAKNLVEIANTIFESMHWKTMVGLPAFFSFIVIPVLQILIPNLTQAACFSLMVILSLSGATLFKTSPPAFAAAVPQHSQAAIHPQPYYYDDRRPPRTPSRGPYALMNRQDETPDTDASPENRRPQMLPPPYETPGRRRSSSKEHRSRSPTKNRSPSKRY